MSAKFFGQWLIERKLITPAQLLEATDLQSKVNISLGQAALRLSYLNSAQVERINLDQQRHDKRFGEIALEQKLLTKEQIDQLLDLQRKHNILFGEAVTRLGFISQSQMEHELEAHRQSQQEHANLVDTHLDHVTEPVLVRAFLDVSVKLFTRMIQQTVKVEEVGNTSVTSLGDPCFLQEIRGDRKFHYFMTLPETHQVAIASRMLKMQLSKVDEVVLDASKEFVNIITGSGCVKLGEKGFDLQLEPSVLLLPNNPFPPHYHAVLASMASTEGPFQIGFLFE